MRRPAIRLVFAPLQREAAPDEFVGGTAQRRTIRIDPRTPQHMGRVVLHELIHIEQPSKSEWWVRRETWRRWRRMTWREKAELYRLLGHAKLVDES